MKQLVNQIIKLIYADVCSYTNVRYTQVFSISPPLINHLNIYFMVKLDFKVKLVFMVCIFNVKQEQEKMIFSAELDSHSNSWPMFRIVFVWNVFRNNFFYSFPAFHRAGVHVETVIMPYCISILLFRCNDECKKAGNNINSDSNWAQVGYNSCANGFTLW